MRFLIVEAAALWCVLTASVPSNAADPPKVEKRSGWVSNATPGNWTLIDKDGEWEIAAQGGEGALAGLPEDRPSGKRWSVTAKGGRYGYGCMSLRVAVDKRTRKVLKIEGGTSLPLTACRKDRAIRKLEPR